jgi:hypothetical protein
LSALDGFQPRYQLATEADQYVRSYFRQHGCYTRTTGVEHTEPDYWRQMLVAMRDDPTPAMQEHISPIAARATYSPDNLIWHPHVGFFHLETKCRKYTKYGCFTADADAILDYQELHRLGGELPAVGYPVVIAFAHMAYPRKIYACYAHELDWSTDPDWFRTVYVPKKPGVWEWNRDRWRAKGLGPVEVVPWNEQKAESGNPYVFVYDRELRPIDDFWRRMLAWPADWRDLAIDVTLDKLEPAMCEHVAYPFLDFDIINPVQERAA